MLIYWLQKISKALVAIIIAHEFTRFQDISYPALRFHRACTNDRDLPLLYNVKSVFGNDLANHFVEGRTVASSPLDACELPLSPSVGKYLLGNLLFTKKKDLRVHQVLTLLLVPSPLYSLTALRRRALMLFCCVLAYSPIWIL